MIWFSIVCLILVGAVVASLVFAIRNKPGGETDLGQQIETKTRRENIAIARERLKQIPTGPEFDDARLELETALVDDLGQLSNSESSTHPAKDGRRSACVVLLAVPLAALVLYMVFGNTSWVDQGGLPTVAEIRDHPEASLDLLVKRLEQTLKDEPDNLEGWMLAARTYISLGRFQDAENAYARANQLNPDDADLLAAWADASLLANGNQFTAGIESRITRSLELNPQHVNALWIAGMGNHANDNPEQALSYLTRLQPLLDGQPGIQQQVGLIIDQLNKVVAGDEQDDTANPPVQIEGRQITATVSIAPELLEQVGATRPVFVFARAMDGPKFPLAVARLSVADLPTTVVLDENSAMMEGQTIAAFDNVVVTARVSLSGEPVAKAGDLTSHGAEVSTDQDASIDLQIDQRVE